MYVPGDTEYDLHKRTTQPNPPSPNTTRRALNGVHAAGKARARQKGVRVVNGGPPPKRRKGAGRRDGSRKEPA